MSKKSYNTPELVVYGYVDELTQARGGSTRDVIVIGGNTTNVPGSGTTIIP